MPDPASTGQQGSERRRFLWGWLEPFGNISLQKGAFVVWFVVAVLIGGMTIWRQLFHNWCGALLQGGIGAFCIVLLADAVSTNLIQAKRTRSFALEEGRAVAGAIALFLVAFQGFIVEPTIRDRGVDAVTAGLQFSGLASTVLVAIYLHCFRLGELERTVGDVRDDQERRVDELRNQVGEARATKANEAI